MSTLQAPPLPDLYQADETAWLETMAELIRSGRLDVLDYPHLAEYLTDMARLDRREVRSRLIQLLLHLLKWEHQPNHRSRSWRTSILKQRQKLKLLASSGVLREHAAAVMNDAFADAIEL